MFAFSELSACVQDIDRHGPVVAFCRVGVSSA